MWTKLQSQERLMCHFHFVQYFCSVVPRRESANTFALHLTFIVGQSTNQLPGNGANSFKAKHKLQTTRERERERAVSYTHLTLPTTAEV